MSTDNNNNNKTAAAAAAAKPAPPPTQSLGISHNTQKSRNTALTYINRNLRESRPFGDDGIETFEQLTPEHVEGDNLEKFMRGFYIWLAETPFSTKQNTWLATDQKVLYQRSAKQVIRERFKDHDLFSVQNNDWHEEITALFKKQCQRSRYLDDNINEVRKSEPLYRDVSDRNHCTAIRAKYLGVNNYDCRTISTNILRKVKDLNTASALAEFNVSRAASGRGGEHSLLRWDEGVWDSYFNAPDFDWTIIKQLDRQCMFFFCDLSLYMICPFFGLAVYFLFGGLRRDDSNMGVTQHFIFPHLHNIKRNGVAERQTKIIRSAIDDDSRKGAYTSRSTRKGQMAELRMTRDLDLTEEYAHSGHHHPSMNSNAEGYIEPNPSIAAPGAMAAAGYVNCHMRPSPYGFEVLGIEAFDAVQSLVSELFTNDMHRLQVGGNLRPVIMICAARLIGAYNDLIRDFGMEHKVVKLIMEAARRAKVDDVRVNDAGGPRYHVVLKDWARQITNKFKEDNDQVSPHNPKVNEELLRALIDRVEKLEASTAARDDWYHNFQLTLDQVNIQKKEMAANLETIKRQEQQIKKLQRMLAAAQHSSPGSPVHDRTQLPPADAADKKRPPIQNLDEEFASTPKKTKAANSTASATKLDGVQESSEELKVGGITVSQELERLWKAKVLVNMSKELKGGKELSKGILFTRTHTDVHGHPIFKKSSEMSKYDAGMTFVALAVSDDDWKKLCAGELDDLASRQLFKKIEKETMVRACEIERQLTDRAKESSKPTVHSLGTRLKSAAKKKKEEDQKFDIDDYVARQVGAKGGPKQSTLSKFTTKRK